MAEEQGAASAEAPSIATLTEQVFAAKQSGDEAALERALADRDELAKQLSGEPSVAAVGSAERLISDDQFAEIEAFVSGDPEGVKEVGPGFRDQVDRAHGRALEIAEMAPEATAFVLGLAEQSPPLYVALVKALSSGAGPRRTPQPKGQAMAQQRNSNASIPPAEGPRREALEDELSDLMKQHPPGTEAYRDRRAQRRVQELSRALAGDAPLVGRGGRTI